MSTPNPDTVEELEERIMRLERMVLFLAYWQENPAESMHPDFVKDYELMGTQVRDQRGVHRRQLGK